MNTIDAVRERTLGYILTALGLVAGLAWNGAIQSLIDAIWPNSSGSVYAQFVYAIIITVAVVVIANSLTKYLKQSE